MQQRGEEAILGGWADPCHMNVHDLYSFGFSMLSPCGARDLKVWVQCDSTLCLTLIEPGLFGDILMNSRTEICMSFVPLWSRKL